MGKPSQSVAYGIIAAYILYGLGCGYMAATQPIGAGWRLFSYHPFLMTLGMITCLGSASIIKKLGGYYNTKMHGVLSWCGLMASLGGLYAIWLNKNNLGRSHLKTNHSCKSSQSFLFVKS